MKREALSSPKLLSLAGHLGASKPQVIGYLTLLWDFTAEHACGGNVGKWDDETIAKACEWDGTASAFINALVASRWVDTCSVHRLVVHDWAEHCENWVRAKCARSKVPLLSRGLKSVTYEAPKPELSNGLENAESEVETESSCARQNLPYPTLAKDSAPSARSPLEKAFVNFWEVYRKWCGRDKQKAWEEWRKLKPDKALYTQIMTALRSQITVSEEIRAAGEFVPEPKYACRWLKGRCWEDEVEAPPPPVSAQPAHPPRYDEFMKRQAAQVSP